MNKDQATEFLKNFITEVNQQDNRSTASPYYIELQEKESRVVDPKFESYDEKILEKEFYGDDDGDESDKIKDQNEVYVKHEWEPVSFAFTQSGIDQHLQLNKHNYGETRRYIKHCHRNPEIQKLFEAIGVLVDVPWEKK